MMLICKKEKCVWRTNVGGDKYFCMFPHCSELRQLEPLNVNWLGLEKNLANKRNLAKYHKTKAKRGKKR